MTQIPAPPVLPKPKSISKHNDAATMEHDALLRIVWRNLDGLIKLLYSDATTKCADSVEDSVASYLAKGQRAAERARKLAEGLPDDPAVADVLELVSRLVSQEKSSVPAVSAEMLEPVIERRTLAAPVKEHKTVADRTKVMQVGFVDIACDVNIPTALELVDNLPLFLTR